MVVSSAFEAACLGLVMLLKEGGEEPLSPTDRAGDLPLLARKLRHLVGRAMDFRRRDEGRERDSQTAVELSQSSLDSRGGKRITFGPDVVLRDACRRADMAELTDLLRVHAAAVCTRVNASGRTALHEACLLGHMPVVEAFLRHGADPNALDSHGRRPLHTVASTGHVSMARLLLEFGAKVHLFSADMRLPVDMACERSDLRMVQLLSKAAHAQEAVQVQEARAHAHAIASPGHAHFWACRRPSVDAVMDHIRETTDYTGKAPLHRRASDNPKPARITTPPPRAFPYQPGHESCHHGYDEVVPGGKRSYEHQRQRSSVIVTTMDSRPVASRDLCLSTGRRPRIVLPSCTTYHMSVTGELRSIDF